MADWGSKVSQLGYDVNTAADNQLLYSSSWPLLMIHAVVRLTVDPLRAGICCDATDFYVVDFAGGWVSVYKHNLGYPPIFWTVGYDINNPDPYVCVDVGADRGSGGTYLLYIFRRALDQIFQAPSLNLVPSTQGIFDHNNGIKVSKPGKSSDSTDLRDFALHSGTISPMIHAVYSGPFTGTSGPYGNATIKYTHGLGYTPLTLFYAINNDYAVYPPNSWSIYDGNNNGGGGFYTDFNNTFCAMYSDITPSTSVGGMVVFKDPFNKPVTNITF